MPAGPSRHEAGHESYLSILARRAAAITPQHQAIPGAVPNSAGGHAFRVDDWTRLDRFLVLGSEGGSYYAGEAALTRDNAAAVLRAIAADGERAVARIVAVSEGGRAPKNDPVLFALALAAGAEDLGTRRAALAALPRVARIGTHLFQFAAFVEGARGWGRSLRRAVGAWYAAQPAERLAYQPGEVSPAWRLVAPRPAAAVPPGGDRPGTGGAAGLGVP